MSSKKTSIIIVNWNGREHLVPCLEALKQQTLPPDEIIVVDNGSSDDSCDYVKRHYPKVQLLELPENLGFSGGNIAGYKIATGDYIILLNNDTKPLANWLEQLVSCAASHIDVGIVASHMTNWEGSVTDTAGDGCTVTGRGFKLYMGSPASMQLNSSGYVFGACAGAALYKRVMLHETGFLDNRFFMNAEDTDLAFRANLQGWRSYFCADAVVRHRISASQGIYSPSAIYYSSRNHLWVYLQYMPFLLMLKYSLSFWLHFLLSLAFLFPHQGVLPYLRGFRDALLQLSQIISIRREQRMRQRLSAKELEQRLTPLSTMLWMRLKRKWWKK